MTTCQACHERPTTNAFVCDPCGDTFAKDLKKLAGDLNEELETAISGAKGVDWRKGTPRGGGEAGLRVNWRATELYRKLHLALGQAVDHCTEVGTRHSSANEAYPARTVAAMALWLTWRVDGLSLDPAGPRHVAKIADLVDRAEAVVAWQPPERRFLGPCEVCGEGHVYADEGEEQALCNRCEEAFPTEARHAAMVGRLDEELLTAAEIGRLSTYLGLHKGREQVRNLVKLWGSRGVIQAQSGEGEATRYRLGDVRHRLVDQAEVAG